MIPVGYITNFIIIIANLAYAWVLGNNSDYNYWQRLLEDWWADIFGKIKKWSDDVYNSLAPYVNRLKQWIDRAEWLATSAYNNAVWLFSTVWYRVTWVVSTAYGNIVWLASDIFNQLSQLAVAYYAHIAWLASTAWNNAVWVFSDYWNQLVDVVQILYGNIVWLARTAWNNAVWVFSTYWNQLVKIVSGLFNSLVWLAETAWNNEYWLFTTAWAGIVWLVSKALTALQQFLSNPPAFVFGLLLAPWLAWMDLWQRNSAIIGDFVQVVMPDAYNWWVKHRREIWEFFDTPVDFVLPRLRDVFIDWVMNLIAEKW